MLRLYDVASVCLAMAALSFSACLDASAPRPLHTGCTSERRIALTFDDGPNPPFTQQFIDILRRYDAAATFFVTGQAAQRSPDLVAAEHAAGMAVGAHSWDHRAGLERISAQAFALDVARADDAIALAAGFSPRLYRAPFGHWSRTMLGTLDAHDYSAIGWDVDSRDWDISATSDEIVANVVSNAHPGAIVLMHDGGLGGGDPDRQRTLAALPRIIDALQRDGYRLVTVPEIAAAPEHAGAPGNHACGPNK